MVATGTSEKPNTGKDETTLQMHIRLNTCINHLTNVARREKPTGANQNQDVIRELVVRDILTWNRTVTGDVRAVQMTSSSLMPDLASNSYTDGTETWPGVLSEKDTLRFGLRSGVSQLDPSLQINLQEELDALMLSISDFLHADGEHVSEAERLERAWSLPEQISSREAEISSNQSALDAARRRIEDMMETTTQTHSDLRAGLLDMISRYPTAINGRRSATNDLLAATIEISLIKLSLIRARAHRTLYGYESTGGQSKSKTRLSMTDALSTAYAKLKTDERKMEEEERELDRQLEEYETMLNIIDGGGGGFAQVVEDWTRVQREKEECRRDLRRLGWTGD